MLKPSGRAAIIVPDNCLSPLDEPSHVAVYDHRRLARILRRHFEIEQLEAMKDSTHEIPILFAVVRTRSSER